MISFYKLNLPLAVFIGGLLILSGAAAELGAAQTGRGMDGGITVHAPDAFYDPPADVPKRPGALLRSERLQNVALPGG